MAEGNGRFEELAKAHELASLQIHREVELVDQRLRWFLTFNGLIFASYVLSFSRDLEVLVSILLQVLFPLAGIILSFTTFNSLKASERMRDEIKAYWNKRKTEALPPFYSEGQRSRLGRYASISIPFTIGTMWLILFPLALLAVLPVIG